MDRKAAAMKCGFGESLHGLVPPGTDVVAINTHSINHVDVNRF
jgi:hypothetical protein